jgi:hypothetical protein
VQDVLANYISTTTALALPQYLSTHLNEVNILSIGYGEQIHDTETSVIELRDSKLFAGPIAKNDSLDSQNGFVDIVKIGAPPPKERLWKSLLNKAPIGNWRL